jgi:SpoVK/Ycf46/Vps4 family AAA+-type ATPase
MAIFGPKIENTQQLAAETLKKMTKGFFGGTPTDLERVELGDKFVTDLPGVSQNPLEKSLAEAAQRSAAEVRPTATKVALYRTAIEAMTEQVTGTAGGVLAGVATKVLLSGALTTEEKAKVGQSFLGSIAQATTSQVEKDFSNLAVTTNKTLSSGIQGALAQASLQTMSQGLTGITGPVLAKVGTSALSLATSQPAAEQAALGNSVLAAITASANANEAERSLLSTLGAAGKSLAAPAQAALAQAGLEAVAGGITTLTGQKLAEVAAKTMNLTAAGTPADRAALAGALLGQLSESPLPNESEKSLYQTIRQTQKDLPETSRAALTQATLAHAAGGSSALTERTLAQIGGQALALAGNAPPQDKAALGKAVLATFSESQQAGPEVKSFLHSLQAASEDLPAPAQAALTRTALQTLAAGECPKSAKELAAFGQAAMEQGRAAQPQEQAAIGQAALKMLLTTGTLQPEQKILAEVVLQAGAERAPASQLALAQAGLKGLNADLTGPIAPQLASLALETKLDPKDQAAVSSQILAGIAQHSSSADEQRLARMSADAAARFPAAAANAIAQSTLRVLDKGMDKTLDATLGDLGKETMAAVAKGSAEERAAVGSFFLNAIGQQTSSLREQALCRVATEVCAVQKSMPARLQVVEATLDKLSQGGEESAHQALAGLALQLLPAVKGESEQRSLALSYLSGISKEGNGLSKLVAPLAGYLDDVGTGLKLAQATLKAIQSGQQDAAKLGHEVLSSLPPERLNERFDISRALVQHLSDQGDAGARAQLEDTSLFRTDEAVATVLAGFLAKTAGAEPDAKALEAATKGELQALRQSVLDDISDNWQTRIDQALTQSIDRGNVPKPEDLGSTTLASSWEEIEARFDGEIEQHPLLRQSSAEERQAVLGQESWKEWAAQSRTSLSFGETFLKAEAEAVAYSGKDEAEKKVRQTTIEKLVKLDEPADQRDLALLKRTLNTLPTGMLQDLEKSKYTITVTRDRVSNAHAKLEGKLEKTGALTDMDEGAHIYEPGQSPSILLRAHWKGGRLHIAPDTLMRQLAYAYDKVMNTGSSRVLAEAFKVEAAMLPGRFQTDQTAFAAEMFTRYQLDPERLARQFPMSFEMLEKGYYTKHKVDTKALAGLQVTTPPVVNVHPDPFAELRTAEQLNQVQKAQGLPPIPYVLEIKGESQHNVNELVDRLGATLRDLRNPGVPRWREGEDVVRVAAATFNSPADLDKLLTEQIQGGRASLLVLDDLGQIGLNSPGFEMLGKYIERFGGQMPLVLQGATSDLERLKSALPTVTHKRFSTAPLTAGMITDLLAQKAQAEGYDLSKEAITAIGAKAKDGELGQAFTLWRGIKSAQTERAASLMAFLEKDPSAVSKVNTADVANAKMVKEKDPLDELERMTGLGAAKRELRSVLAQVKLQKAQQEFGITGDPPRLNLLFEGNPGTGKTTVAKLFADALTKVGYLKNNKFKEVRVQDLLSGKPEENVKRLFEQNKGGVIFLDEMHQLKDTQEGRLAFRAMIPYLGHPEYADTVFIGAGYKGEMRDLIRDVDDGAERRFTSVPFEDYTRSELGSILDKMVVDKQRVLDEPTREAALMRLERERRKMKNFGNAGSVMSMLDIAIKKQTTRLTSGEVEMTKEALQMLAPDDFAAEKTVTPEEVWAEINALEGLENLKGELRTLCDSIEYDKEMGNDPLASFEPYFILDGPPGTGKTTMARLIVKLMAAYDIIPSHNLSESQGADLQAGFVGQTTTKVQKLFESMWGQGGFIDEIGGLARAPEAFKADAAKTMLKQMEDHRGRFILVVADYADRVNDFLNIDPGISRRFGHRFSLEPLGEEAAVRSLCKQLGGKDLKVTDEVRALIATRMTELHAAPNWASSGDVRKVLNSIVTQQKTCFLEARANGRTVDPKEVMPEAVNNGFDSIMREKKAREIPIEERPKDEGLAADTAAATQKPTETQEAEEVKISAEEQAIFDAQAEVDKEFAAQIANDPALQAKWEADPNSAYIKRLAEKLGVTPEEAIKSLQAVKIKIKKMVTNVKLVKRFEYHCPYCGGINSPTCAYIGQSLDWKIQHSLKKPWTEEVKENQEVEVEVNRD